MSILEIFENYWEGIVAVIALLTSIISTWIAYHTFKLQRIHNTKSVKPIIHIGQWDYENKLYVTLKNVGNGLALVNNLKVSNGNKKSKDCIYDWLPKQLPGSMNYSQYWTPTKFVVQSNEEIRLIEIPIDLSKPKQVEIREKIRKKLGQLTVEVDYKDIYDNQMDTEMLSLEYFNRKDNEN